MEAYNHFEYGEMLATRLRAVAHTPSAPRFFCATEEEEFLTLEERLSSVSGTILIAVDGSNADYQWQPDNMTERPQYFFILLTNTVSDRPETIHQAQSDMRTIARQVIARMMQDARAYCFGLSAIDPDSFIVRGVGPLLDNFYGVLLGFNMINSFNYELNPEYWL